MLVSACWWGRGEEAKLDHIGFGFSLLRSLTCRPRTEANGDITASAPCKPGV